MRYLITALLVFILSTKALGTCPTSADYVDPISFPRQLTLNSGDTLLLTSGYNTPWTSIAVHTGGLIIICDSSIFRVNGSLSVYPGGRVELLGCEAKLKVYGTYNGGYSTCEMEVYNCSCDDATDPFTLIWGNKIWDEWCCMVTLPIELISFSGHKREENNVVYWSTATEVDNDYFSLERSIDGITWEVIEKRDGTNVDIVTHYTYVDILAKETYYYRLKQTDYNGVYEYSETIVVTREPFSSIELYRINLIGEFVDKYYHGVVIIKYNDGRVRKTVQ